jgi:hypothetical protein
MRQSVPMTGGVEMLVFEVVPGERVGPVALSLAR